MARHDDYTYDELNVEAKLNCLARYVYNICPYEDLDFSDCWCDMDYLVRLIEYSGYECRVIDFDMIEWR